MAAKDWLVPLAVGGLAFVGLLQVPMPASEGVQPGPQPVTFIDPFPGHVRLAQGNATVLVVDRERAHALAASPDFEWRTPHVGVGRTRPVFDGCGCAGPMWHVLVPSGEPRLGGGGFNATRVAVHVFDAEGELVASNGNASELRRLTGHSAPERLPGGVWYLGANATAPNGTQPLPLAARALLPQLRALLDGLPVGGVATLATDALHDLYGTLYVTARVEQLVHAP